MSLILEALRKSEAERRRGQTPDLLSDALPVAPAAHAAARNTGTLLAVAAAALITLLLVAWWLRPSATPALDSNAAAAESIDPDAADDAMTAPAVEPARPRGGLQVPAAASTVAAAKPAPAVLPPPPRPQPTPAAAAPARTDAVPPAAVATPIPAPAPPPAQVASTQPPIVPAQPAFTSVDVPLRLADLPTDERQQLPALKVSMHMWASESAHRFAIIDGTRVNEGDRVGDATVEAIQQDGVLLAWRGRSIRLPIR